MQEMKQNSSTTAFYMIHMQYVITIFPLIWGLMT